MFTNLSTLFDRNFVVGHLLPAIGGIIALVAIFSDVAPFGQLWIEILTQDKFASLTLLILSIWLGAILLSVFNISIFRLVEGYTGPFKREAWREQLRKEFIAKRDKLRAQSNIIRTSLIPDDDLERRYAGSLRVFRQNFPHEPGLVLPTRFGNVVRAAETYSLQLYGADSIPVWLRLTRVIPESYQSVIEVARAEVNFFLNAWCLVLIICTIGFVRFFWGIIFLLGEYVDDRLYPWKFLGVGIAGLSLAYVCYRCAVARAYAWGDYVRSAFDLYLPALANQLGYSLPDTAARRMDFWDAVNTMFLTSTPMNPMEWPKSESGKPK